MNTIRMFRNIVHYRMLMPLYLFLRNLLRFSIFRMCAMQVPSAKSYYRRLLPHCNESESESNIKFWPLATQWVLRTAWPSQIDQTKIKSCSTPINDCQSSTNCLKRNICGEQKNSAQSHWFRMRTKIPHPPPWMEWRGGRFCILLPMYFGRLSENLF